MNQERLEKYRHLTAAQQFLALQLSPVCSGNGWLDKGALSWEYWVQPTPLSRQYKVRISYQQGAIPIVHVLDPNLKALANGRTLPHVYDQDPARLCLYLPGSGEWTRSMKIVDTIVPWTMLWLYYFEDWLTTAEWKGGGKHPDTGNGRRQKNTVD